MYFLVNLLIVNETLNVVQRGLPPTGNLLTPPRDARPQVKNHWSRCYAYI